jgi:hypothetical protein
MADRDENQAQLCDICHRRPASLRVTVAENGRRRTLSVCREDYAQLRAQQASPFESLFGGSLFGDDMLRDFFDDGLPRSSGQRAPRRQGGTGRDRESIDVGEILSAQAEEILQQAARIAGERGGQEVDSEHLLYALADNDVVQAIIVFHALDREQIREIVGLQLERVKRMARGQCLTLEFDESLIDHFADVGYQPEFGARELRRQVRSQLETRLANAMLRGEIVERDTVTFLLRPRQRSALEEGAGARDNAGDGRSGWTGAADGSLTRGRSVGLLPDPVSRRLVVADPEVPGRQVRAEG